MSAGESAALKEDIVEDKCCHTGHAPRRAPQQRPEDGVEPIWS
jgi:hypothetical protein